MPPSSDQGRERNVAISKAPLKHRVVKGWRALASTNSRAGRKPDSIKPARRTDVRKTRDQEKPSRVRSRGGSGQTPMPARRFSENGTGPVSELCRITGQGISVIRRKTEMPGHAVRLIASQTRVPRRAPANAPVWPGIVRPRRWRSSAVVRFISRFLRNQREKNFMRRLHAFKLHGVPSQMFSGVGHLVHTAHIGAAHGYSSGKCEAAGHKNDMRQIGMGFLQQTSFPVFLQLLTIFFELPWQSAGRA